VRPLLLYLKNKWQRYYYPGTGIVIDESMLSHKGTLFFKQYLPKKKTKWGIENWLLCCAQTSYVFDLDVYAGSETKSSNKTAKKVSTKAGRKVKKIT